MKKFQKHDQEISLIFNIIKWKFTKGTNNKLLAALFDISGDNLSLRVPFNLRSWVTRWWKIFKKLRECVFLTDKSNQPLFFVRKKILSMKTAQKTGYFSIFHVVHHVVDRGYNFFSIICSVFTPETHICAYFCSVMSHSRLIAKKHPNLWYAAVAAFEVRLILFWNFLIKLAKLS